MKKDSKELIQQFFMVICWIFITAVFVYLVNLLFFRHNELMVYKTKTGERYHSGDCGYLHSSKVPIGLNQAIEEGLSKCYLCGGKASGIVEVNSYDAAFIIVLIIEFSILIFAYMLHLRKKRKT